MKIFNGRILISTLALILPASSFAVQSYSEYQLQRQTAVDQTEQQLKATTPDIRLQVPTPPSSRQTAPGASQKKQETWQRENPWQDTTSNPWKGKKVRTQGPKKTTDETHAAQPGGQKPNAAPAKPNIYAPAPSPKKTNGTSNIFQQ